jgi:hypothetical protein
MRGMALDYKFRPQPVQEWLYLLDKSTNLLLQQGSLMQRWSNYFRVMLSRYYSVDKSK